MNGLLIAEKFTSITIENSLEILVILVSTLILYRVWKLTRVALPGDLDILDEIRTTRALKNHVDRQSTRLLQDAISSRQKRQGFLPGSGDEGRVSFQAGGKYLSTPK